MSMDPGSPYQSPMGGNNPPPASRSRGILLGLGIGCGLLLLLCCGGFAGVTWWGKAKFKESTSEDPVVVRKVGAEIAEVPLPPDFEPRYSMNMTVPFTEVKIKGVVYNTKKDGFFVMGEFDAKMADAERENFLQEMRRNVRMQGNANDKLEVLETKTVELKMRGKPASFKFGKAQNLETKEKFWQLMGTFNGREGPAMIMMIVPLEQFSESQLKQMFEKTK